MNELKYHPPPAPWQSTATISVAPAAFAPRTAALISSVYKRRPSSYIGAPPFTCSHTTMPLTPSMSDMISTRTVFCSFDFNGRRRLYCIDLKFPIIARHIFTRQCFLRLKRQSVFGRQQRLQFHDVKAAVHRIERARQANQLHGLFREADHLPTAALLVVAGFVGDRDPFAIRFG